MPTIESESEPAEFASPTSMAAERKQYSQTAEFIQKFRPAASKRWLLLLAGLLWAGVGIMLYRLAIGWLKQVDIISALVFFISGFTLGLVIHRFGFSKLALKNIQRIQAIPREKVCIFAFQEWTSYPLVAVMIAMGIALRHYSPIPKSYLAVLYLGIGGGLFLASMAYFENVRRLKS